MIYVLLDNNNRIVEISKDKFKSFSSNLTLCEVESLPTKFDYLVAENIRREVTKTWQEVVEDYDDNGELVSRTEERSRTYNTCDLVAKFRPQPTSTQIEAIKQKKYEARTEELIAKKYSIKQEIAIARQKDVKPEEYQAYYDYCEECKTRAHIEIYGE